jgi:undecaprenyl-diphosphatase
LSIVNAIILGIIQGLTEFLPVSSSGHLVIAEHLLPGWQQTGGIVFEILLHLATLLAVIIFFRKDLMLLIQSLYTKSAEAAKQRHLLLMIILATIPTGIIGLAGKKIFVGLFERLDVVGGMLLITALLLWLAESPRTKKGKRSGSFIDAVLIGITQGLAIIPGISRSGSTISVAMMLGIEPEKAARFSFLISIPAISGAALLSFKDLVNIPANQVPASLCGAIAAFVTGLLALKLLLMIIKKRRLRIFSVYCAVVGCGALFLAFAG